LELKLNRKVTTRLALSIAFGWIILICRAQNIDVPTGVDGGTPPVAEVASADGAEISVQGAGHREGMSYESFLDAKKAYDEYRHFAPNAPLLFAARTHSGDVTGLKIKLIGDNTEQIVEYDEKGQFKLPFDETLLKDNVVLVSNLKRGEIFWVPVIRTEGLPDHAQRMGDLRLYCRVRWALDERDTPLHVRIAAAARGNCNASHYRTAGLPKPGMRVKLAYQGKEKVLEDGLLNDVYVSHHTRWVMPLGDSDWPDDTSVTFLEPTPDFVLDKDCADLQDKKKQDAYEHGSQGSFSPWQCVWRPE
jgi:hypothetical protein